MYNERPAKEYFGKMNADSSITWTGPMSREDMIDRCDIFRNNSADSLPRESILISVEEAERITLEYYDPKN